MHHKDNLHKRKELINIIKKMNMLKKINIIIMIKRKLNKNNIKMEVVIDRENKMKRRKEQKVVNILSRDITLLIEVLKVVEVEEEAEANTEREIMKKVVKTETSKKKVATTKAEKVLTPTTPINNLKE